MRVAAIGLLVGLGIAAGPGSARSQDAPPAVHCLFGPFVLTFDHDSSRLPNGHKQFLARVIEEYSKCGGEVVIEAFTPAGEPPSLQRERMMSVFTYLRDRGVDPLHIIPTIRGSKPDPTADGRERHVQIWVGMPRQADR